MHLLIGEGAEQYQIHDERVPWSHRRRPTIYLTHDRAESTSTLNFHLDTELSSPAPYICSRVYTTSIKLSYKHQLNGQ